LNLAVDLLPHHKLGLPLKNPVMVASGFGGYGGILAKIGDLSRLGAIVTNPISLRPWPGTPQPRLKEVPAGFLLRTGNQNPGLRHVMRQYAKAWANARTPLIVRICGADASEYAALAGRLENVEGVAGFEVAFPPLNMGRERVDAGLEAIRAASEATILPVLALLPLLMPLDLPQMCVAAGADALTIAAPGQGMLVGPTERTPFRGEVFGAGMLPLTLHTLWCVAQRVQVPLIGRGSIHAVDDVLAYLMAGAQAAQVGSALLRQPGAVWDILDGLERWMLREGIEDIAALVGKALPPSNS